jgi:hypothetical protein
MSLIIYEDFEFTERGKCSLTLRMDKKVKMSRILRYEDKVKSERN